MYIKLGKIFSSEMKLLGADFDSDWERYQPL